jgi:hypothetical protein
LTGGFQTAQVAPIDDHLSASFGSALRRHVTDGGLVKMLRLSSCPSWAPLKIRSNPTVLQLRGALSPKSSGHFSDALMAIVDQTLDDRCGGYLGSVLAHLSGALGYW